MSQRGKVETELKLKHKAQINVNACSEKGCICLMCFYSGGRKSGQQFTAEPKEQKTSNLLCYPSFITSRYFYDRHFDSLHILKNTMLMIKEDKCVGRPENGREGSAAV